MLLTIARTCRAPHFLCMAGAIIVLHGCGVKPEIHGKRAAVNGAVLLDGDPLDRGIILFRSPGNESKVVAAGSVRDGFYEIAAEHGPLVGEMRVEIRSEQKELEEFEAERNGDVTKRVVPDVQHIPACYNTKSELTAVVSEDETENKFDFILESK